MTKLQEILSHIPVKFENPVLIKDMPVTTPLRIYSIEKTEAGEVLVQISDGSFHKLEEKDRNYDFIADTILKRLGTNTAMTEEEIDKAEWEHNQR